MKPDLATLRALAARLERATGADREIDRLVWRVIGATEIAARKLAEAEASPESWRIKYTCAGVIIQPCGAPEQEPWLIPGYTGSLDAVAALHERLLPGWKVLRIREDWYYGGWNVSIWHPHDRSQPGVIDSIAATECLARLRAVVSALIAQADGRDGAK